MIKISLVSYALLLGAVWFFYPEFTATSKDSVWSSVAFWATVSAGKTGTLVIVVITCLLYAISQSSFKKKMKVFVQSFLVLGGLLTAFAFLNEHLLKPVAKFSRPSHAYLIRETNSSIKMDSLYELEEGEREAYFQKLITADTSNLKSIDPRILDHWVEESGYSFPSGHSFNAFLLASIVAFGIYDDKQKRLRYLAILPLSWAFLVALSRVAVGAHSAIDVSVGAGMGLILGIILLCIKPIRRLIIPRSDIRQKN